jgi:ketosteroid isomerase-like protein
MRSTQEVFEHHLQCFAAGDLEGTLADFAENAVLLTPDGALRGRTAIREFFSQAYAEFAQPGSTSEVRSTFVEGDLAFVCWEGETAERRYEGASDAFLVRGGMIEVQTFCAKITTKRSAAARA